MAAPNPRSHQSNWHARCPARDPGRACCGDGWGIDVELIIVRHGETAWTLSGRHTGATDLPLTEHGRLEAAALRPLLGHVLAGREPVVYASPRERAAQTLALAMPGVRGNVEPLVAEYDYGTYEGLTHEQISTLRPGWNIWRDGCPAGESTGGVGARADAFLIGHAEHTPGPVVVVSHGHFSRILAARALGLAADHGRLLAAGTASVSVVKDFHGERCIALWNASADLLGAPVALGRSQAVPDAAPGH
ncbi:histidine phosphatase family protein [Streptomyces sp. H39-C1]|uniref:histidine phosphatase family protein n=1 Tax=Streptomyces sp. H39-C1 TaxID=3004355 RepID=UPI003FA73B62